MEEPRPSQNQPPLPRPFHQGSAAHGEFPFLAILLAFISCLLLGLLGGYVVSRSYSEKADRLSGELASLRAHPEPGMAGHLQDVGEKREAHPQNFTVLDPSVRGRLNVLELSIEKAQEGVWEMLGEGIRNGLSLGLLVSFGIIIGWAWTRPSRQA